MLSSTRRDLQRGTPSCPNPGGTNGNVRIKASQSISYLAVSMHLWRSGAIRIAGTTVALRLQAQAGNLHKRGRSLSR